MLDAILVKTPEFKAEDPSFYLDVHKSMKESFAETFYKYKTRKEATLHSMSEVLEVTSAFTPGLLTDQDPGVAFRWQEEGDWEEFQQIEGRAVQGYTAFVDPRLNTLGARTIGFEGTLETEADDVEVCDEDNYHCFRILNGVPEGPPISGLLPLSLQFDRLNSVSFNKGCYVGQELTQRTHTQGEVRTVIMPFIQHQSLVLPNVLNVSLSLIDRRAEAAQVGQTILNSAGQSIGKVVEARYNLGLAMVKRELLGEGALHLEGGSSVMIWKPIWQ
jgi:folate-binding protein YgfZ